LNDQAFIRQSPISSRKRVKVNPGIKHNSVSPPQNVAPTVVSHTTAPLSARNDVSMGNDDTCRVRGLQILSPFLPAIACKILDVPTQNFDNIEWQSATYKVPREGETAFFTWSETRHSQQSHFVLQEYQGWSGTNFRIVATDPVNKDQFAHVVLIAKSTNQEQIKQLMDILEEIENLSDFEYSSFWIRLNGSQ